MIFEKIRERLQKKVAYYNAQYESFLNRGILSERAEARFKAYKEAIDIINQVEAEYNNGWIPCEVELPKIATSYLVAEEVIVNSKKLYVVDIRLFGTEDEWLCPSNRKIIAWQPLPQPPKGE